MFSANRSYSSRTSCSSGERSGSRPGRVVASIFSSWKALNMSPELVFGSCGGCVCQGQQGGVDRLGCCLSFFLVVFESWRIAFMREVLKQTLLFTWWGESTLCGFNFALL